MNSTDQRCSPVSCEGTASSQLSRLVGLIEDQPKRDCLKKQQIYKINKIAAAAAAAAAAVYCNNK